MLYPKNSGPLTPELFQAPTSEYRGTPFWAWNNRLDADELTWQIEQFKKMGFGGFHMHVRSGMATEYMSEEFLDVVEACVEKARQMEMLAWLYDEDRCPSGAAGGYVTRHKAYRQRSLLLTRAETPDPEHTLLARFSVTLDESGYLTGYRRLTEGQEPESGAMTLWAYEEIARDNPWFNHQAYVDTLNPDAIAEFLRQTHDKYARRFGRDFGGLIPAIFTDEPQFTRKSTLAFASDETEIRLPWTGDLEDSFRAAYDNVSLLDALPELLWDLPGNAPSLPRYRYHDHVAERFVRAFSDQCGRWCGEHGLLLTGHLMEEPTLQSQTTALGEAMRSYRAFGLPGIDILCDWREFSSAKQAQSAARQYGREGVLSELYGVNNWTFDFRGQKLQGDWQAALGITVRVPHLSLVSMNGGAKRDYPASFNYQSPWFEQYRYLEDHYARVNTAMTRGRAVCRIGVIHPIESYWLHWGARESSYPRRQMMEQRFDSLLNWLLRATLDFDYICESTLPEQCAIDSISERFPVGEGRYDVLLVPGCQTLRGSTLERLERFTEQGGRLIFLGEAPALEDARLSERGAALAVRCKSIPFERLAVLQTLDEVRELSVLDMTPGSPQAGTRADNLLYQLREEAGIRWLFIAPADKMEHPDFPQSRTLKIQLRGAWTPTIYDSLSGCMIPLTADIGAWTTIEAVLYEHDSLLLRLDAASPAPAVPVPFARVPALPSAEGVRFTGDIPVTLEEPNVLVLDMPEYALDDGPWREREEILRLDNLLRTELGWLRRSTHVPQPWAERDDSTPHTLHLRYTFTSKVFVETAMLVLEHPERLTVTFNGQPIGGACGWFTDKCLKTCALPPITAGENRLELSIPYGRKVEIEACYILGDFGVGVAGDAAWITEPVRTLRFGDITRQGLPFYGGNLTYHLQAETVGGRFALSSGFYRGTLLRAAVDGTDAGVIALSPYRLELGELTAGLHRIDLTCYGCRVNTFGQLHNSDRGAHWWGPNSWRTTGSYWTYEYLLWPQGIMKSPELFSLKS